MTGSVGRAVLKTLRKSASKLEGAKLTLDTLSTALASAVSAATLFEIFQKAREKSKKEKLIRELMDVEKSVEAPSPDIEKTAQKKKLISSIVEKKIKLAEDQQELEKIADFVADLSEKSVEELSAINDALTRKLALKELEFGKGAARNKSAQEALEEFLLGGSVNE